MTWDSLIKKRWPQAKFDGPLQGQYQLAPAHNELYCSYYLESESLHGFDTFPVLK